MGRLIKPSEYARKLNDWLVIYPIAGVCDRTIWLDRVRRALLALDYLEILRGDVGMHEDPMVEIRGRYSVYHRNTDLVMLDVEGLWNALVPQDVLSMHSISGNEQAFSFRFALVQPDSCVLSGVLNVFCTR